MPWGAPSAAGNRHGRGEVTAQTFQRLPRVHHVAEHLLRDGQQTQTRLGEPHVPAAALVRATAQK